MRISRRKNLRKNLAHWSYTATDVRCPIDSWEGRRSCGALTVEDAGDFMAITSIYVVPEARRGGLGDVRVGTKLYEYAARDFTRGRR